MKVRFFGNKSSAGRQICNKGYREQAVADPGFPTEGGGGANPKGVREKLLFGQFFTENCMKIKVSCENHNAFFFKGALYNYTLW